MATKLTLRMSPLLIEEAKYYAGQQKKSLSQVVGDYFLLLTKKNKKHISPASLPLTQSLRGVVKAENVSRADYRAYLEDKYR